MLAADALSEKDEATTEAAVIGKGATKGLDVAMDEAQKPGAALVMLNAED